MVEGHAKGVPVETVGSVEYGKFGASVEGHAKAVSVDWTPASNLPENRTAPEVIGHAKAVSVDWTPRKGYESGPTPMSERATKQSE